MVTTVPGVDGRNDCVVHVAGQPAIALSAEEKLNTQTADFRATLLRWAEELRKVRGDDVVREEHLQDALGLICKPGSL